MFADIAANPPARANPNPRLSILLAMLNFRYIYCINLNIARDRLFQGEIDYTNRIEDSSMKRHSDKTQLCLINCDSLTLLIVQGKDQDHESRVVPCPRARQQQLPVPPEKRDEYIEAAAVI